MKKIIIKFFLVIISLPFAINNILAEGKPATELNKTVRTDGLSGLNLFLAHTYNENRLLFAITTTLTVVILGLIITYIVGIIIKPHAVADKHE